MNAIFLNTEFFTLLQIIVPIITLACAFALFIILPQQLLKKQQQHLFKKTLVGMRIKTIHGICGTISSCAGNFIIIELDDGRKIEILRQTITSVAYEEL